MLLQIQPYSRNLLPAIALFNSRLQEAGIPSELRLPLDWVEPSGDSTREERYLIVEDTMVRGGYILRHERFWINREVRGIGFLRLPLSEGIINKSFAPVGARILKTVSTQSIPLFALGMGGTANPFPRMLSALGWSIFLVPFYYRVYSVAKVLKDIRPVPRTFVWRAATDIASHSGMGWLLFNTLQSLKQRRELQVQAEQVCDFGAWADDTWLQSREQYSFVGVRDAATLNALYSCDRQLLKLKIVQRGTVGWAVVVDTKMQNHKQFGDLRVGTIVDCLSTPGYERVVIQGATDHLRSRGVDLIISNQSHTVWRSAMKKSGFLKGPSNFAFASSPNLTQLLCGRRARQLMHINRGNGDGPIHLK